MELLIKNIIKELDGTQVPVISINNVIEIYNLRFKMNSDTHQLRVKLKTGENGDEDVDIEVDGYEDHLRSLSPSITNISFTDFTTKIKYMCSIGLDHGLSFKEILAFFKGEPIKFQRKFKLLFGLNKYNMQVYICPTIQDLATTLINLIQEGRKYYEESNS